MIVISDKWLILVIILIILVIFSFDYQAIINKNSIRIFFEEYEYPTNGIFGLLEEILCFSNIEGIDLHWLEVLVNSY